MSTTSEQDNAFLVHLGLSRIFDRLLEESIRWIGKNMSPEDVFSTKVLKDWAVNNSFIDVSREEGE